MKQEACHQVKRTQFLRVLGILINLSYGWVIYPQVKQLYSKMPVSLTKEQARKVEVGSRDEFVWWTKGMRNMKLIRKKKLYQVNPSCQIGQAISFLSMPRRLSYGKQRNTWGSKNSWAQSACLCRIGHRICWLSTWLKIYSCVQESHTCDSDTKAISRQHLASIHAWVPCGWSR